MYGGRGSGSLAPLASTAAGVALLPNTGGNPLLMVVSIVSILTGSVILLSTLARYAAKKAYKA